MIKGTYITFYEKEIFKIIKVIKVEKNEKETIVDCKFVKKMDKKKEYSTESKEIKLKSGGSVMALFWKPIIKIPS